MKQQNKSFMNPYKGSIVLNGIFIIVLLPFVAGAYLLWDIGDVTIVLIISWIFVQSIMNLLQEFIDTIMNLTEKAKTKTKTNKEKN